jgi:hypothetical protein
MNASPMKIAQRNTFPRFPRAIPHQDAFALGAAGACQVETVCIVRKGESCPAPIGVEAAQIAPLAVGSLHGRAVEGETSASGRDSLHPVDFDVRLSLPAGKHEGQADQGFLTQNPAIAQSHDKLGVLDLNLAVQRRCRGEPTGAACRREDKKSKDAHVIDRPLCRGADFLCVYAQFKTMREPSSRTTALTTVTFDVKPLMLNPLRLSPLAPFGGGLSSSIKKAPASDTAREPATNARTAT